MISKKIDDRIMDMFNKGEFDNDFINIELDSFISTRLFNYQYLHVYNLISCLKKNDVVIDGSDTGTGKTYTSLATVKHLKLTPIIICPKGSINIWKNVCNFFLIRPLFISNYEQIREGCSFLQINNKDYKWNINDPRKHIVIFDEAHKCRNVNTLNSKLLLSLKNVCKIMLLSATLCDNPKNFTVFGYMLNFYDNLKKGKKWIENIILEQDKNKKSKQNIIYKYIFPEKGSRMCLSDIKNDFPMNQINVNCFDIDNKYVKLINNSYQNISKCSGAESLVKINYERQQIEKLKIPIILDLIQKYLEHNKSIAVFINYIETLTSISKSLDDLNVQYCKVDGSQTLQERQKNIDYFQTNKVKVILCTIQSGGQSINLHDLDGKHPRVSLICPSFSSTELIQTLGRIYRVGLKSPALQIILFCADTVETKICEVMRKKINFLDKVTDNDLFGNIFK
ncbi:DEAD/SNF2-like helicase [Catovirus CTV1]|uniref:DEAD/SNF2-like helicase n=1 Tax=Catovirus CTV1 TaxID=1977631 RepID=A0A1V0SBY6_9VIRU|nr:DEAD/SNF2-like helicase [Catovirus CTV1]